MTLVLEILLGIAIVVGITALTGYFVAQEFGYMAVDRSRLKAAANAGDAGARRALAITRRTSFMLSGAQLGITVTGLLVGYVAEPMIGEGVGELLGGVGVPEALGIGIGTVLALLIATVVQMVFGELFPKNLAIARPEPVARALALSTAVYLRVFGWLIHLFDAASNVLLRAVRIEPVHDVEHAATPRDLEAIIGESRVSGDLHEDLSRLLDRVLDFTDRTARAAMIPRPQVASVRAGATVAQVVGQMNSGHSRYPVLGAGPDDVVGVICLRDVLALEGRDPHGIRVEEVAREPVMVPDSLPLPTVLARLRDSGEELACVVDEYGDLAGVVTMEDIAEELVGEITDEHDRPRADEPVAADGEWLVPGGMHVDEVERLVDADLPHGPYQTIGGLAVKVLGRLPEPGDVAAVRIPGEEDEERILEVTVRAVDRHVAREVRLRWVDAPEDGPGTGADRTVAR
ncbi:MAG: hemolysin family protein [Pseudonocardia sp.]